MAQAGLNQTNIQFWGVGGMRGRQEHHGGPTQRLPEPSVSDSLSGGGEQRECMKVQGDTPVNSGIFFLAPCSLGGFLSSYNRAFPGSGVFLLTGLPSPCGSVSPLNKGLKIPGDLPLSTFPRGSGTEQYISGSPRDLPQDISFRRCLFKLPKK